MKPLTIYLTFKGNCKEAMLFYKNCLGGRLVLQTVGDSLVPVKLPQQVKSLVLQAKLKKEEMVLLGTDMCEDEGLKQGNAISILLECQSVVQMECYFKKLSEGGRITHPIKKTYWGGRFGGLTDKFGNRWLFKYSKEADPVKN